MSRSDESTARLFSGSPLPEIDALASAHDAPVYLVGGALRDAVAGRSAADLDIAVAGELEVFVDACAEACGRRPVEIGDEWRDTRRTRWAGVQVDVARLLGSLDEDLAQRDFTINAMAVELNPETCAGLAVREVEIGDAVVDPHGGLEDVGSRQIRMVAEQALDDDPLRLLRGVRYLAVLDGFDIEAGTRAAIEARGESLGGVFPERVQTEWRHLLAGPHWIAAVRMAAELGLAGTLADAPDLDAVAAWAAQESSAEGDRIEGRLAALLLTDVAADPEGTYKRLVERRWAQALARRATRAAHWAGAIPAAGTDDFVDWVLEDREAVVLAAQLARCADAANAPPALDQLELFAHRAVEDAWVTGFDLRSWGLTEGPELGAFLAELRRGQIRRRWASVDEARDWTREHAESLAGTASSGAQG